MVTVMFTYAACNEPKTQLVAVREGHFLDVYKANTVLRTIADDAALRGRVELAVFLDGITAFKDAMTIGEREIGDDKILTRYLQQVARHYDREGEIQKRNSILCLLGAIAIDEAE